MTILGFPPNEDEKLANAKIHWRCFHCNEVFEWNQRENAADHFGTEPFAQPICQIAHRHGPVHGLVVYIRELEHKLYHTQVESDPVSQYWYDLASKHRQEVITAEQKGYDKGLADGREHYKDLLNKGD